MLKAIEKQDPALVQEAEQKSKDGRAKTSPANGKKGGREFLPVDKWAKGYIANLHTQNKVVTLREYNGKWYQYKSDCWSERTIDDIKADVTAFLQKYFSDACRISTAVLNDFLINLKSNDLCHLDSGKYQMPCFLTSGESAKQWLPMKNEVINVELAAQAAEQGKPLPENARRAKEPDLFSTFTLDYDFDPEATCPKWESYLEGVQPDPINRETLQMMTGLLFVPDCSYNVAFFLFGIPGTGKGTFINVLESLIGKENCCTVPLGHLANRFGLAPLTEKLVNLVGDMPYAPENGRTADVEGLFKSITSGDIIKVERKNIDGWEARAVARMIFATNHLPDFTDRSAGVYDRLRIIPFNQRFRDTPKQNRNLLAELLDELPGIFNWSLKGLAKLRKLQTFPDCPEGERIKSEHRNQCDHEREFLSEKAEESPGGYASSESLYKLYKDWMLENGYKPLGQGKFKNSVKAYFPKVIIDRQREAAGQITVYRNIRLKNGF